jgi:hypothetical protein
MPRKHRYIAGGFIFLLVIAACNYADYREKTYRLEYDGKSEKVRGVLTKPAFFHGAERLPFLGRAFTPDEYRDSSHVLLFTQLAWELRFHANVGMIGKNIKINGDDFMIVGVMGPSFDFPGGAEFARPD